MQQIPTSQYSTLKRLVEYLPSIEKIDLEDFSNVYKKRHTSWFGTLVSKKNQTWLQLCEDINKLRTFGSTIRRERYQIVYGESWEIEWKKHLTKSAFTLENLTKKYGKEEAEIRWNSYRAKQAYSNSFEFKQEKHGWTREEFDEFNRSRACTLKLFKKRYGKEEGKLRWKKYCELQAFTNTKEYLKDRYEIVNKKKAITLPNLIAKFGKEEGERRFNKFLNGARKFYSQKSIKLFEEICKYPVFKTRKCYYATNGGEYGIWSFSANTYFLFDFVCAELKLAIEFNGDHYHGNPEIYKPSETLRGRGQSGRTALEAWKKDEAKTKALVEERDIDTITIWELDYDKNPQDTIKKIIDYAHTRI